MVRPELLLREASRAFQRYRAMPKAQLIKTGILVFLGFIITIQLLGGSAATSSPAAKSIAVVKPGQTSNENYGALSSNLENMGFGERCSQFFEALQQKELSSAGGIMDEADFAAVSSRKFSLIPSWEDYLAQKKKENKGESNSEQEKQWHKEYIEQSSVDKSIQDKFLTFLSNVRIYGACYVETNIFEEITGGSALNMFWGDEVDSALDETNLFHLSNDFGLKYFSWLSQIRPVYQKIGSSAVEPGLPDIVPSFEPQTVGKASFLYNFKNSMNGKGIVIPVKSAKDFESVLRMAKVLRFIGNTLPVQIVHDGYIGSEEQLKLQEAFTAPISHTDFITHEIFTTLPKGYDVGFPVFEEVWTVNIALAIDSKFSDVLSRDSTFKTIAMLLSSFDEALLLDPKVLPLRKLLEIMDDENYQTTGSYYFPYFNLQEDLAQTELSFIGKLFPTQVDERVFGIAEVNMDKLAHTRMFGEGKTHAINNEVVALNKRDHFLGLLLAAEIQLMPILYDHESLKEDMLFLGPLAAGASRLYVHNIPVSVIGDYTPEENRRIKQSVAKEICSQHKGYLDSRFSSNATVMFITGGARNCDHMDPEKEKELALFRTLGKDDNKLKDWAQKSTQFKAAIIPIKQEITFKNNIDEIPMSLTNEFGYCDSTIWCAWDVIGARDEKKYHGDVVDLGEAQSGLLDLITQIWQKF